MSQESSAHAPAGGENIALLYQGILTGIVRVQSGRQPLADAAAFRRRMQDTLAQIEREAVRLGYTQEEVSDTNYAVVAFVDEVMMNSGPRTQWSLLQAELYEGAQAGERFYEQIKKLCARHDSARTTDVLEVYLLCLLLGYQGRYAVGPKAELRQLIAEVRERIEAVRGKGDRFSPADRSETAVPVQPPARRHGALPLTAAAMAGLACLGWLAFRLLIGSQAEAVRQALLNALAL